MGRNTSISLGNHFTDFVDDRVKAGCYVSASEAVTTGMRLLEQEEANLVVRNGSITGMGTGLLLSYDGRAENIKALRNGHAGMRARLGAAVVDSTGTSNGQVGIEGALITGCVASHNGQYGIATGAVLRYSKTRLPATMTAMESI
ncbi:MAG TPA: type II toxin-antitoxin system ParD family antitoxin [Dokdonella sp.]|uniref:type II toxin-antitoxin system ParD family antitoxin n=1 Tax=Dokdonella sp. TaxID=2291710 RepID=UPI002D8107C1|nr:type II toxin-antitoxin system ParD family antitoxin [Dokdonella sp.]HET9031820.1 type II toxin-antitoxin system ParD family antitoxin [Dokdonella sp.]